MSLWQTLKQRAHTPYSTHAEVCIVRSKEGRFWPGVRVENASFPDTVGCIQAALFICLSEQEAPAELIFEAQPSFPLLNYWVEEFKLSVSVNPTLEGVHLAQPSFWHEGTEFRAFLEKHRSHAIVPHSNFRVSALLKTKQGWISGVNIEVSDWRLGLCAERVSIVKAIAHGLNIEHDMHVNTELGEFCSPCGACRQVLLEHLPEGQIGLHHPNHTYSQHFIADLLPWSFRASNLLK